MATGAAVASPGARKQLAVERKRFRYWSAKVGFFRRLCGALGRCSYPSRRRRRCVWGAPDGEYFQESFCEKKWYKVKTEDRQIFGQAEYKDNTRIQIRYSN